MILNILHVLWLAVNCYHPAHCGVIEWVSAQTPKIAFASLRRWGDPLPVTRSRHSIAPSRRPRRRGRFHSVGKPR
jgi:hypothetical protein